ncbi:MAG: hypothetical protein AAGA61_09305 [Pseudomonadota bacterium]
MHRIALLGVVLIVIANPARAEFSYDFVDIFYGQIDFDNADTDGDNFGARVSLSINDAFHVFGGASVSDLDLGADATTLQVGVGYNTELTPIVDLVTQLSYRRVDLDTPIVNTGDDGLGLDLTLRVAVTDLVEFNGSIDYSDLQDGGDNISLGGAVLVNLTERLSFGVIGDFDDDISAYSLLARIYF